MRCLFFVRDEWNKHICHGVGIGVSISIKTTYYAAHVKSMVLIGDMHERFV